MPEADGRVPLLLQLATANAWASQLFDQEMTRRGLQPQQFGVLTLIALHEPITPSGLHAASGIPPATVRLRVHQLVEAGAVRRVENSADRRSHFLVTTAEGRRLTRAADAVAASVGEALGMHADGDCAELAPMLGTVMRRARELACDDFLAGPASAVSGPW